MAMPMEHRDHQTQTEGQSQTQWGFPPAPPEPAVETAPAGAGAAEARGSRARRGIIGFLIAAGVLVLKFGAKLKVLLLLLPKVKIFTTSASMLVSIAAYALIWGWRFAIGFVALLFVHELGHYIQLRREGVKPGGMVFIPFLGAAVWAKSLGGSALAEARVGLAGPVLGSLGAAALIPLAAATGNDLFRALAFVGLFLNLFNLVPVLPLDGGRAMAAMAPWMWFVGLGAMIAGAVLFPNPVILLVVLLGGLEIWRRWKLRRQGGPEQQSYYNVRPAHRLMVAGVYIGLIVLLGFGMSETYVPRTLADA
jgi:Zn-dependent protease